MTVRHYTYIQTMCLQASFGPAALGGWGRGLAAIVSGCWDHQVGRGARWPLCVLTVKPSFELISQGTLWFFGVTGSHHSENTLSGLPASHRVRALQKQQQQQRSSS